MKCWLNLNTECSKLKYYKDEWWCDKLKEFMKNLHHHQCMTKEEFDKINESNNN